MQTSPAALTTSTAQTASKYAHGRPSYLEEGFGAVRYELEAQDFWAAPHSPSSGAGTGYSGSIQLRRCLHFWPDTGHGFDSNPKSLPFGGSTYPVVVHMEELSLNYGSLEG